MQAIAPSGVGGTVSLLSGHGLIFSAESRFKKGEKLRIQVVIANKVRFSNWLLAD